MQDNMPIGPNRPFTKKFLEAKFSLSFDRLHLTHLLNAIAPLQFQVGDPRNKVLLEVVEQIKDVAFSGINESDYEPIPGQAPTEPLNTVAVN